VGDTIWVRRKSRVGTDDSGDDFDHSLFCRLSEELDALAGEIGVRKLSDFFDFTDYQFNLSDEDLPESWIQENEKWFHPADALPSLGKLLDRLRASAAQGIPDDMRSDLIEELEDCLAKVQAADRDKDEFHFCIVM
jgi:hypothetical protein